MTQDAFNSRWFYVAGSEKNGPFSEDELFSKLRSGMISSKTLVWKRGFAEWTKMEATDLYQNMATNRVGSTEFYTSSNNKADLNFFDHISECFRKYATFSGRANRAEFWYFALFVTVISICTSIADAYVFPSSEQVGPANLIFSLFTFVPYLAASTRRLHDTDRSAWSLLIVLIPVIGVIILIYYLCQKGSVENNKFG